MTLHEMLEAVEDQASFLRFVEALQHDRNNHGEEWQNSSIDMFLESSAAWLNDTSPSEASWKLFASFLYAGKIYE